MTANRSCISFTVSNWWISWGSELLSITTIALPMYTKALVPMKTTANLKSLVHSWLDQLFRVRPIQTFRRVYPIRPIRRIATTAMPRRMQSGSSVRQRPTIVSLLRHPFSQNRSQHRSSEAVHSEDEGTTRCCFPSPKWKNPWIFGKKEEPRRAKCCAPLREWFPSTRTGTRKRFGLRGASMEELRAFTTVTGIQNDAHSTASFGGTISCSSTITHESEIETTVSVNGYYSSIEIQENPIPDDVQYVAGLDNVMAVQNEEDDDTDSILSTLEPETVLHRSGWGCSGVSIKGPTHLIETHYIQSFAKQGKHQTDMFQVFFALPLLNFWMRQIARLGSGEYESVMEWIFTNGKGWSFPISMKKISKDGLQLLLHEALQIICEVNISKAHMFQFDSNNLRMKSTFKMKRSTMFPHFLDVGTEEKENMDIVNSQLRMERWACSQSFHYFAITSSILHEVFCWTFQWKCHRSRSKFTKSHVALGEQPIEQSLVYRHGVIYLPHIFEVVLPLKADHMSFRSLTVTWGRLFPRSEFPLLSLLVHRNRKLLSSSPRQPLSCIVSPATNTFVPC